MPRFRGSAVARTYPPGKAAATIKRASCSLLWWVFLRIASVAKNNITHQVLAHTFLFLGYSGLCHFALPSIPQKTHTLICCLLLRSSSPASPSCLTVLAADSPVSRTANQWLRHLFLQQSCNLRNIYRNATFCSESIMRSILLNLLSFLLNWVAWCNVLHLKR